MWVKSRTRTALQLVGLAVFVPLGLTAFGNKADTRTLDGSCQSVFGGQVCTTGTMSGNTVMEFGLTVPMITVTEAPLGGPMVFPPVATATVPLPPEVVKATGFDHVGINWEAHGHPPALFMTPHFDFHFFRIGPAAVQAIDCSDARKPAQLPGAYTLPDIEIPGMGTLVGLCVPQMGMHAMPSTEVTGTVPFGASMLVGYYGQRLIALEPMISQAKLAEKKSFTMTIPRLPAATGSVKWPTKFEAIFDVKTNAYRFVFSGLPAN